MNDAPAFFVPFAEPGADEEAYAAVARRCCVKTVPPLGKRVYSITWRADGELWTATVGEALHGKRVRGGSSPLSDPAEVLAIFPGDPYLIGIRGPSTWSNPLLAGRPESVVLFS